MSLLEITHPQATHTALLGGARVAYLLVRSSRRSIGLEIGPDGLVVRAPLRAPMGSIESVLHEKTRWVLSKLQSQTERVEQTPHLQWCHGGIVPYLGGQMQLQLHPAAPRTGELLCIGEGRWALHLCLPAESQGATVRAALAAWWLRHARDMFHQQLQRFAPLLGVQWRSLRVANPRTRWGSAKTDGTIMLNWRLLHYRQAVLDYVVIHELSHLRVMDHSPRFWAVVGSICPDYLQLRAELRSLPSPSWEL